LVLVAQHLLVVTHATETLLQVAVARHSMETTDRGLAVLAVI
jgi:hypothetical protein